MICSRSTYVELLPSGATDGIPVELLLGGILREWVSLRLDPDKCRTALEGMLEGFGLAPDLFRLEGFKDGGMVASERLLHPTGQGWRLIYSNLPDESFRVLPIDDGQVRTFADSVRAASQSGSFATFRDACTFLQEPELLRMLEPGEAPLLRWSESREPGIYRREHASLVIQSRTTRLLLDPIYMNASLPRISEAPMDGERRWDAILVSHGHLDHWHVPSLLYSARTPSTPIIVPQVPRTSLLTSTDFTRMLQLMGQNVLAPAWGESVTIGDIDIDILPFYGEQPTPTAPGTDAVVRNWGNCYRFTTPEFSVLVLVDSGEDPAGRMIEVAEQSMRKRGPVDVVLSCLRQVHCPFMEGLPHYWATLPFGRLQELFGQYEAGALPSSTAGTRGAVEVCAAARARYFLPYANGFAGVGESIPDIGWGYGEPREAGEVEAMATEFARRGLPISVRQWNVGERASFQDGALRILR